MASHDTTRTTTIFYDGTVNGIRIINKDFSPVTMYIIPREHLMEAKDIDGIMRRGIYMLIKEDEDCSIEEIYVGQTRVGLQRIYDHNKKKDWWNKVIMTLGDDQTFTLDMISGLEKYGIDMAYKSGYTVYNSANPQYTITSYQLVTIEKIFEDIEFLLATQGYSLVKKHRKKSKSKPASAPEPPAPEEEQVPETPAAEIQEEPAAEAPAEEPVPVIEAPAEPAQAQPQPHGTWISLDKEFNPTGYKIQAFSFKGETHETSTYRSLLKDIINLLYKGHSAVFEAIADGGDYLSGRMRRDSSFNKPEQIEGTDIYFEANWSAVDSIRFVRYLLDDCSISPADVCICLYAGSQMAEPLPSEQENKEDKPHYDAFMEGILHISAKDVTGLGKYNPETGELTVLEGSQINLARDNTKGPAKLARNQAIDAGDILEENGYSILQKPYTFTSPSAAGMFILGSAVNGKEKWVDSSQVPLKDLYFKEQ
ncbi:MAG: GIY-YIG nuclease family protein [Clostridia bacterium]|nr:GIY-YIG nuclease family protein [Clostridia bacterium]